MYYANIAKPITISVGDRLWHLKYKGWGRVEEIHSNQFFLHFLLRSERNQKVIIVDPSTVSLAENGDAIAHLLFPNQDASQLTEPYYILDNVDILPKKNNGNNRTRNNRYQTNRSLKAV